MALNEIEIKNAKAKDKLMLNKDMHRTNTTHKIPLEIKDVVFARAGGQRSCTRNLFCHLQSKLWE